MSTINRVYCDESCHIQNDGSPVMVIGGIWGDKSEIKHLNNKIKDLKIKYKINLSSECKWIKISPSKINYYLELLDLFFDSNINYRAVIVHNKDKLNHEAFHQTHNKFYSKIYYLVLRYIVQNSDKPLEVYIDIKDSNSYYRAQKLLQILRNTYDISNKEIVNITPINSKEIRSMELADIFTGALAYCNRSLNTSKAKIQVIKNIEKSIPVSLTKGNTTLSYTKFNLLQWEPRKC